MINNRLKDIEKRAMSICIILVALLCSFLCGCSCGRKGQTVQNIHGFSITFIDVGDGECIFIKFDDNKNMLIDSGYSSDLNFKNISSVLDGYKITSIDYLVLTHPDADHVGNIESIMAKYSIKNAFLPRIENKQNYRTFDLAYNSLVNSGTQITYTSMYQNIEGDNYFLAFLSPCYSGAGDYYGHFNGILNPTEMDVNDLSPIIYLECKGYRFIFTGDASIRQENLVISNYNLDLYTFIHEREINLYDVDLLKLAHHGSDDSNGGQFLSVLKPKKAVVSVGGDNIYGHPSSDVLSSLYDFNPNAEVLRTDVMGNITVRVDLNGELKVSN